eukprot:45486_1
MASQQSPFTKLNSTTFVFDECKNNIKQCSSLERIKILLSYYQNINTTTDIVQICSNYKSLINDYIHLINDHDEDTEYISTVFNKRNKCSLKHCDSFRRYKSRYDKQYEKEYQDTTDIKSEFYVDMITRMHLYFFHSCNEMRQTATQTDTETDDSKNESIFDEFKHRHSTKYCIEILPTENNEQKLDENQIPMDDITFAVGKKFYYWKNYKNKNEIVNDFHLSKFSDKQENKQYSELYVEKK